jgi:acyl-coenzyme A synthetase/AMP-(fatty) acid ligase
MRYDTKPIADYDLSTLRVLGSVGKRNDRLVKITNVLQ